SAKELARTRFITTTVAPTLLAPIGTSVAARFPSAARVGSGESPSGVGVNGGWRRGGSGGGGRRVGARRGGARGSGARTPGGWRRWRAGCLLRGGAGPARCAGRFGRCGAGRR